MSSTRMISASMYRSWREAARSNHRVGHHQGGWQGAATAALALGPADRRGLSTQSASDRAGNYKDGKGGVAPGAKLREEKSKQGGATSAPDAKAREQAPTASSSGKMGAGGKPTSAHGVPKKHENRGEKGPVQKFQRLRDISDIDGADQFKRNKSIMAHQNLVELTEECAMEGMLYSAVNVSAAMGMIGKLSQRSKIRSLKDQDALARAVSASNVSSHPQKQLKSTLLSWHCYWMHGSPQHCTPAFPWNPRGPQLYGFRKILL